jgi:hypothetical protein
MSVFDGLSGPFERVREEGLRETLKAAFPGASAAYVGDRQGADRQWIRSLLVVEGRFLSAGLARRTADDERLGAFQIDVSSFAIRDVRVRTSLVFAGSPPTPVDGSVSIDLPTRAAAPHWGVTILVPEPTETRPEGFQEALEILRLVRTVAAG